MNCLSSCLYPNNSALDAWNTELQQLGSSSSHGYLYPVVEDADQSDRPNARLSIRTVTQQPASGVQAQPLIGQQQASDRMLQLFSELDSPTSALQDCCYNTMAILTCDIGGLETSSKNHWLKVAEYLLSQSVLHNDEITFANQIITADGNHNPDSHAFAILQKENHKALQILIYLFIQLKQNDAASQYPKQEKLIQQMWNSFRDQFAISDELTLLDTDNLKAGNYIPKLGYIDYEFISMALDSACSNSNRAQYLPSFIQQKLSEKSEQLPHSNSTELLIDISQTPSASRNTLNEEDQAIIDNAFNESHQVMMHSIRNARESDEEESYL